MFNFKAFIKRLMMIKETHNPETFIKKVEEIYKKHPGNRSAKYLLQEKEWFLGLSEEGQKGVMRLMASGTECPNSSVGVYVTEESDLEKYRKYLEPILQDYHNISDKDFKHSNSWDGIENLADLPVSASIRSRVAVNVRGWDLPTIMTKKMRIEFLKFMQKKVEETGIEGTWYVFSEISKAKYQELVKKHLASKDMSADKYLKAAGISDHFPHGRAAFIYEQDGLYIGLWIGEEDHLRIWAFGETNSVAKVLGILKGWIDALKATGIEFMEDKVYGNITTCLTNFGTGNRTSVLIALPNLLKGAEEIPQNLKDLAESYGIQIRGTGGEHTPIENNMVDLSIKQRMGITPYEIAKALTEFMLVLLEKEKAAK